MNEVFLLVKTVFDPSTNRRHIHGSCHGKTGVSRVVGVRQKRLGRDKGAERVDRTNIHGICSGKVESGANQLGAPIRMTLSALKGAQCRLNARVAGSGSRRRPARKSTYGAGGII